MKKLFDFLLKLASTKFYGEVVIKFENGRITHLKKTESYLGEQFN